MPDTPNRAPEQQNPDKKPTDRTHGVMTLIFVLNALGVGAVLVVFALTAKTEHSGLFMAALLPVILLQLGVAAAFYRLHKRQK